MPPLDASLRRRRKQLAAIHVLAARLKLDDSLYRDLLERVSATCGTARRSAANLTDRQRGAVMAELRRLSGDSQRHMRDAVPPPAGAPQAVREDAAAMVAKIGAMLADGGRGWAYAHGVAKRMFGVARIEWCTSEQLHRIVAALSYDQLRRRKNKGTTCK